METNILEDSHGFDDDGLVLIDVLKARTINDDGERELLCLFKDASNGETFQEWRSLESLEGLKKQKFSHFFL